MTQQDFDYRDIHAVVPQLDFVNGGLDNVDLPPVQFTQFAFMSNPTRLDAGRLAGGAFGAVEGALHMAGVWQKICDRHSNGWSWLSNGVTLRQRSSSAL